MISEEQINSAEIPNMMIFYTDNAVKVIDDDTFVPLVYADIMPYYLINRKGEIFSIVSNRILTPRVNQKKYLMIDLMTRRRRDKTFLFDIHVLVANTFVDNPLPGVYKIINHIIPNDGTPECNYYKNLEWCTTSQNNRLAWKERKRKKEEQEREN